MLVSGYLYQTAIRILRKEFVKGKYEFLQFEINKFQNLSILLDMLTHWLCYFNSIYTLLQTLNLSSEDYSFLAFLPFLIKCAVR